MAKAHQIAFSLVLASTLLICPSGARPDDELTGASQAVFDHLSAIEGENYSLAESFFSDAFRVAVKPEVKFVNAYLLGRREAIRAGGFKVGEAVELEEPRYASVEVKFEKNKFFYFLIREAKGWRIEAFSYTGHETMADARRPLYLWTNRDWNDTEAKELKCRGSLFRIQQHLERYRDEQGEGFYPERLRGGRDRDDLTIWGYINIVEGYPENYFKGSPMAAVKFGKPVPGDFTYLPVDTDGDGKHEGYYLVGYGEKEAGTALFENSSIVGLVASADERDSIEVMQDFISFIEEKFGQRLIPMSEEAAEEYAVSHNHTEPRLQPRDLGKDGG